MMCAIEKEKGGEKSLNQRADINYIPLLGLRKLTLPTSGVWLPLSPNQKKISSDIFIVTCIVPRANKMSIMLSINHLENLQVLRNAGEKIQNTCFHEKPFQPPSPPSLPSLNPLPPTPQVPHWLILIRFLTVRQYYGGIRGRPVGYVNE